MNLDFTEVEELLKNSAKEFLEKEFPKDKVRRMEDDPLGYEPEMWKKMAELGWLGLLLPEKYGGSDGTFMDLAILLEEMGRACFGGPFLSTTLAALVILDGGSEELKKKILPEIASGKAIMALALTEASARYDAAGITTTAAPEGKDYIINGTKLFVNDAQAANYLICAARTKSAANPEEGITLFLVDRKKVQVNPLKTIADDKQNEVIIKNVRVEKENILGDLNKGWPLMSRLLEKAALAKCAEMIGMAGWVQETSLAYAKERVQYGKPIGSFGIIQTYLADMWAEVTMAKRLLYYVSWLISQGLPHSREVSMAKARISEVCRYWSRMGVQIHGGIGTTRDHDIGLYYRRARQAAIIFGDADFHLEKVAEELGL